MSTSPLETPPRAIVVGASSGIGAALVRELAGKGYRVAALARRTDALEKLCAPLENAHPYTHDVTDYEQVPALFQQITRDLGGLDVIIYNAGVQPAVTLDEFDFAKDRAMIEVNVLGAMAWLNQAALRFSRAKTGQIVGISSVAGDRGRAAFPGYHTSKGALSVYLESLRNRLDKQGVTVTTIKPGFVDTPLLENAAKTFWVISAESAAHQIHDAIQKKKHVVYTPARWRYVMLIIRHIPSFIFRRLTI